MVDDGGVRRRDCNLTDSMLSLQGNVVQHKPPQQPAFPPHLCMSENTRDSSDHFLQHIVPVLLIGSR